jgi:hypothetical protein
MGKGKFRWALIFDVTVVTGNLVDICSISSHLGNLLRQTVAQINMAEESIGKNSGKFKPMSVLAELLVNHLQTPHETFVPKEHYEEVKPVTCPFAS